MSEVASRWALFASMALHFGVVVIGLVGPGRLVPSAWARDFWAGKTFEVPDDPSDLGEGETPSSVDESSNEISIDGVDPSPNAEAPTKAVTPDGTVALRPPARPRTASRTTLSSTAPASAHGAGPGGTFGAESSAPGVRDLVGSFVRALPIVASSDAVTWATLPLGPAGSADVTLALDEEGKPHVAGSLSGPRHFRKLILKTVSIMSGGRFGIASAEGIAPEQKIHVAITLTQGPVPSEAQAVSGGVFGLRFDPPDEHNVRHAFFTHPSGRNVDISVRPRTR
jgi:hypothetical protein